MNFYYVPMAAAGRELRVLKLYLLTGCTRGLKFDIRCAEFTATASSLRSCELPVQLDYDAFIDAPLASCQVCTEYRRTDDSIHAKHPSPEL